MNEIYWITRLDNIGVFISFLIAIFIVTTIATLMNAIFRHEDYVCKTEKYSTFKHSIIWLIVSITLLLITSIAQIAIPSTKEAYQIYGLGSTIDYLKTNKNVKDMPDKTIKLLNLYLNNKIEEELNDSINMEHRHNHR